jgi:ornithine decarboxylase
MYVPRSGQRHTSTIAGPTCDSIDVPYENIALPELEVGDVLLFGTMGAYTNATSTRFNALPPTKVVAVD